ncbi:alpha-amylase family glycosyl hydrolase [Quadrisphaera sp. KR29]|uniref:alpha-amylase family glycosyl hydrolase n=1 Tax=Quadrisphaera sp. KR29 TaxID=3461391 RepID=UPI004044A0CD
MQWSEHVMWWHVYPLGATGAPVRPALTGVGPGAQRPQQPQAVASGRPLDVSGSSSGRFDGQDPQDGSSQGSQKGAQKGGGEVVHRLRRLEAWLDHVVHLGLNGLALGPVFASSTHGYDTVDHLRIDSRLGDETDFDRLITAAHQRGIKVLLDGVFNHVGRAHPAFTRVEAEGPGAPGAEMFRIDWQGWRPGQRVRAEVFEGHDQLIALNHDAPMVTDLVVDVMDYWLGRGADGWRLDAAYAVPTAFWAAVLPRVRQRHPHAWFSAEVIHGDYGRFVQEATVDSLTQYELWQGIWHSIADANFYELAHAVQRHNALLETFVPSTFIGNHDVTRIASAVEPTFVPHALAVLFTVAGVPSVYAGDEYAATGIKEQRLGGDDAVRPELPAHPPGRDDIGSDGAQVLSALHDLVSLRRRHPWLVRAHTDVVHLANLQVVLRTAAGGQALIVALNLASSPTTLPVAGAVSVVAGLAALAGGQVQLPARGWAVLQG